MAHPTKRPLIVRLLLWGVGTLVGLVLLVLLFDRVLLPAYVHADTVTVPTVEKLSKQAAFEALESRGLSPEVSEERADDSAPAGTVLMQTPQAQSVVKEGRRVYLVLSSGEQRLISVPSLIGRSERDARLAIEGAALTIGRIDQEVSENPPGTVTSQSIAANTQVRKGTAINLMLSQGRSGGGGDVTVPSVVNLPLSEAQRLLSGVGLQTSITYRKSNELLPNVVIDQQPASGTLLSGGVVVQLTVAGDGPSPSVDEEAPLEGGGGPPASDDDLKRPGGGL